VMISLLLICFSHFASYVSLKQKGMILSSDACRASLFMQVKTLTKRSFINMSRDLGYYWLRLVIYILVSLCIGSVYFKIGTGHTSILVGNIDVSSAFVMV
jgi:hypothetical protein